MVLQHFTTLSDISSSQLNQLLQLAHSITECPDNFSDLCHGKILGTLFFEPSTRTRLSFESAMQRLGGTCLGLQSGATSSTTKGETLADTIQTVSCYTDVIAMRHFHEGAATLAAEVATVPLINAGDGGHLHPTQTLTDLLTILETKSRLDHLTVGFCGDLKFGRTVHSLIQALIEYDANHFVLISPTELKIPDYIKNILDQHHITYTESETLEEVIDQLDVLYMTRVQKERFFNEADYERLKDTNILDLKTLERAKSDLAILHPLPRLNEIHPEVDQDPRAAYFKQVQYGVYVRMALLLTLLEVDHATDNID
ncbi:aspartate carbamoyltransferase [Falseniella ignava]|uniref:Aspartate carbamoyltransferase n=1 Tax=Falseniella ignava TaxID=137730 RepID=A0A2I1K4J2_9LACT|nr:aspartate carbamoyltransferase [Falseniella ignava]PKY90561.1 aspartate carbamoyltransferase [Falseniella ignava]